MTIKSFVLCRVGQTNVHHNLQSTVGDIFFNSPLHISLANIFLRCLRLPPVLEFSLGPFGRINKQNRPALANLLILFKWRRVRWLLGSFGEVFRLRGVVWNITVIIAAPCDHTRWMLLKMSSPHCARLSLQHSIFPLLRRLTRRTNHDQIPLCTKTPVYRSIRLMKTPLRNATLIDFLDAGGHSNRPPNRLVPNTKEFTHS